MRTYAMSWERNLKLKTLTRRRKLLAPLVRRVDNAIHWVNLCLVDSAVHFVDSYPLDSDLSDG